MTIFCFLRPVTTSRVIFITTLFLLFWSPGCQTSSTSNAVKKLSINSGNAVSKIPPAPEANVFIDEVKLAKPYAVIGGTVQNVGADQLEMLSIDIELRRRDNDSLVKREVNIEPSDLSPGEKGKFTLKVFSDEWSGSRILSLRSGLRQEGIAFKSLPGAKRPPEKLPEGKITSVKSPQKRSKSNGEEFLNTPDTPVKVP